MLIKVEEVSFLICRHTSTVDKYIAKGLLPSHCKRDKKFNKTRYWNRKSVLDSLPKVRAYQNLTTGQRPQKPRNPRKGIKAGYIPPLTPQQLAANNAFNLCVNTA